MFNLAELAAHAAANNNSNSRTPMYELPLEEARQRVVVKDGNRKVAEDGSQALTLTIGKITLSLDAVAPKATRINATKEQVDTFKEQLQEAVKAGVFDEAIIAAQAKANPNKAVAPIEVAPIEVDTDIEGAEDNAYL